MNTVIDCDIITSEEVVSLSDNISKIGITWAITHSDEIVWYQEDLSYVDGYAIRPCLRMDECNLDIGTSIKWLGLTWTYIGNAVWLCDYAIAYGRDRWEKYMHLYTWLNAWYQDRLNRRSIENWDRQEIEKYGRFVKMPVL